MFANTNMAADQESKLNPEINFSLKDENQILKTYLGQPNE